MKTNSIGHDKKDLQGVGRGLRTDKDSKKMTSLESSDGSLTAMAFADGVVASILTPFDEHCNLASRHLTNMAFVLSRIDGILGVAVNTTIRERLSLKLSERQDLLRNARKSLSPDRIVLACVGPLSAELEAEVLCCRDAGADAVITFPPRWRTGPGTPDFDHHIEVLAEIVDGLSLPIIAACGDSGASPDSLLPDISSLAGKSDRVIGVDMGAHNDVSHYDHAYYALKAIERPLACLPSSEAALFHNLNTGADGAISCLAFIAPHEVVALYRAVRSGYFYEAQAIHNRLAPLTALISGKGKLTREMILREIAHQRGLLPSPHARGVTSVLDDEVRTRIKDTLNAIGLQPIGDAKGDP